MIDKKGNIWHYKAGEYSKKEFSKVVKVNREMPKNVKIKKDARLDRL